MRRFLIAAILLAGCEDSAKVAHRNKMELLEMEYQIVKSQNEVRRINEQAENQKHGRDFGVTLNAYNRINMGTGILDVDEIVGGTYGREVSRAGNLTTWEWSDGFKRIVCTFRGYKLVSKSQVGL